MASTIEADYNYYRHSVSVPEILLEQKTGFAILKRCTIVIETLLIGSS